MPSKSQRASSTQSKYPVKLTPHQREAVVTWSRLKRGIKNRLRDAGEGTQLIEFSWKELEHLNDELCIAESYTKQPMRERLVAVRKRVAEILSAIEIESLGVNAPSTQRPANEADLLFQFKITLRDLVPAVWRRIQVRDCTLGELHVHIQAAMGWENYHLHDFRIDGKRYEMPAPDDLAMPFFFENDTIDENTVRLTQLIPEKASRVRWLYVYDFGDNWEHEVVFEGYPEIDQQKKYPLCLDGRRACPPEDIGGTWGYVDCLEALEDPEHERHEEVREWLGRRFDPEAFDANKATKAMRQRMPK